MTSDRPRDLSALFIRLAALWVLAGALFKLLAGTPNDLPPILHELPISIDLFFKLAIGMELAIVSAAFLRPKLAWVPMVGLFVVFGGILSVSIFGGEESCGCFGSSITIPPAVMMAIDGTLLIAILACKPWTREARGVGPSAILPLAAVGALVLPFLYVGNQDIGVGGTEAAEMGGLRYVVIEPETWKDQLIYDTDFAALFPDQIETLPTDGLYIFWRWDCDHCAGHLQRLADTDDLSTPIVLVRLKQDTDNEGNQAVFAMPTGGHVIELSLPSGPQYVIETPADFVLEGGMIVRATEGIKVDE